MIMYSKKKLLIITVAIVGVLAAALSVGVVSSQLSMRRARMKI